MAEFRCWAPENCEEEDAKLLKASEAEWAAERYVEQRWADDDHPDVTLVFVRDEAGQLTKWEVWAEPDVAFRSARLKEKP